MKLYSAPITLPGVTKPRKTLNISMGIKIKSRLAGVCKRPVTADLFLKQGTPHNHWLADIQATVRRPPLKLHYTWLNKKSELVKSTAKTSGSW